MKIVNFPMKNPCAREIRYADETWTASADGTCEQAIEEFVEAVANDFEAKVSTIAPPKSGSTILVREASFKRKEETEWNDFIVE